MLPSAFLDKRSLAFLRHIDSRILVEFLCPGNPAIKIKSRDINSRKNHPGSSTKTLHVTIYSNLYALFSAGYVRVSRLNCRQNNSLLNM